MSSVRDYSLIFSNHITLNESQQPSITVTFHGSACSLSWDCWGNASEVGGGGLPLPNEEKYDLHYTHCVFSAVESLQWASSELEHLPVLSLRGQDFRSPSCWWSSNLPNTVHMHHEGMRVVSISSKSEKAYSPKCRTISLIIICPFSTVGLYPVVSLLYNSPANRQYLFSEFSLQPVGNMLFQMSLSQYQGAATVCFLEALAADNEVCLKVSNMRQQWNKWNCWSVKGEKRQQG